MEISLEEMLYYKKFKDILKQKETQIQQNYKQVLIFKFIIKSLCLPWGFFFNESFWIVYTFTKSIKL